MDDDWSETRNGQAKGLAVQKEVNKSLDANPANFVNSIQNQ